MFSPLSIMAWAWAAWASGKVAWTIGLMAPCSSNGQARSRSAGNGALEGHGARTQRGTGDGEPATHDLRRVHIGMGAAQLRDDDDAAVVGQALDVAADVVARHHVQDHVHAASAGGVNTSFTKSWVL